MSNIFENLPLGTETEIFENIFSDENILIERIVSNGVSSPVNFWYNQTEDEWVLLLDGEAEIEFANESKKLKKGDFLFIPANQKHRVSYVSKQPNCIWLAIHFKKNRHD